MREEENYSLQIELEHVHWWYIGRRAILASVIATLDLPPSARVLDVGCGAGGNRPIFGPMEVFGTELHAASRERALQQGYTEVIPPAGPADIPYPERRFDLITALDVIEHIEDDRMALEGLRQVSKPGGWLLLTVPACPSLMSYSDESAGHFRRYRLDRLKTVVTQAGYECVYISYFNFWLFPLVALVKKVQKLTNSRVHDLQLPSLFLNSFLAACFSSERLLIKHRIRFPIGVSLIVLARNP